MSLILYWYFTFADIKTNYLIINKSSRQVSDFFKQWRNKKFYNIFRSLEPFGTKVKKGDGKTL